ncbi:unnamed protein product [Microthlaspi erraticum]|uniref:Uncharacterized protein n=1 Tax=Microthlaspi erraticum TaxID=1685480 RepID=A0A6D2JT31_9BRAS|nr:unnamed protein product [Microthlaspi erraticum]
MGLELSKLDRVEAWPVELRNSTGWSSRWSSWSSRWLPPSSFAYPVELRPCAKSSMLLRPICSRMLQKTYFKGPNMHITKLRKFGRARRSSRRPKVTILIWKDRYLSHASRRSGMKPFGSTMRPRLIFYRDMSGKRVNEAHGGFGVSNGPSSSAKGLDRIEKRPG